MTVLFADLADFTTFAEDRSADDVGRVVGDLLQLLGRVVEDHGGSVDKFLGDAVMATFGLPRPDPQASRNAVRAGLALQHAARAWCRERKLRFSLRVGIHAGEVMFRSLGESWTVMGDTVNTASRIQSAATPGHVWISRPVYEEVRRWFTFRQHAAIELKGKKRTVEPFEVLSERTTPVLSRPPFLGREQEWQALTATLAEATAERGLRVVVVRGAAGVGKSRLVRELREHVDKGHRLDVVQYDTFEKLPSHGVNTLLRARFDLPADLGEDYALATLRQRMAEEDPYAGPDPSLAVEFFAFALGILRDEFHIRNMDGRGKWEGTYLELKKWLEGWARRAPWIWILEDAQKGDAETAAFLTWALKMKWDAPVVVVVTVREEDFHPEGHWYAPIEDWVAGGLVREIKLRELAAPALARALTSMHGGVPPEVARRIAEHTEGNPLFAIEILRLLDDQGTLREARVEAVTLPGTIREVMEARLERLGPSGKEVAKRGALMGRRFTAEAVARIWDRPEEELEDGLQVLRQTETVYEERAISSGEIELVFRHARLREAALARIPREDRLRWLAGLEAWARAKLDQLNNAKEAGWEAAGTELLPLIARSREEHGDAWEASLWQETLGLLHRKHHRLREANAAFHRALASAGGSRWYTLAWHIAEGESAGAGGAAALAAVEALGQPPAHDPAGMGGVAGSRAIPRAIQARRKGLITDAMARWEEVPEEAAAINLDLTRAHLIAFAGELAGAEAAYRAIERRLDRLEDDSGAVLRLRWARGFMWFLCERRGNPREAQVIGERLRIQIDLSEARHADGRRQFFRIQGICAWRMGEYAKALVIANEEMSMFDASGGEGEDALWNFKGNVHVGLGDLHESRAAYRRSLMIARATGNRRAEAIALHNIGSSSVELADWDEARKALLDYRSLSRAIDNRLAEFYAPLQVAAMAAATGDHNEAERVISAAIQDARKNDWVMLVAMGRANLGQHMLLRYTAERDQEILARARAELDAGLAALEAGGMVGEAGEQYAALAFACHLAGDRAGVAAALQRARQQTPESHTLARIWLQAVEALISGGDLGPSLTWFRTRDHGRAVAVLERFAMCASARVGGPQAQVK